MDPDISRVAAIGRPAGSVVSNELPASATPAQTVPDDFEVAAGVLAQGRDRGDADHDDQGEHDRIFHGGRTVFGLEELDDVLGKLAHDSVLSGLESPVGKNLPIPTPRTACDAHGHKTSRKATAWDGSLEAATDRRQSRSRHLGSKAGRKMAPN